MKAIILAAGYATRLYPLTENFPKPLLPVGGKAILDWLVEDLWDSVEQFIVVTNHKFVGEFEKWAVKKNGGCGEDFAVDVEGNENGRPGLDEGCRKIDGADVMSEAGRSGLDAGCQKIIVIDDGTETNEPRLGAVKDIQLAAEGLKDDVLVMAGDNVLTFSLVPFISYGKASGTSCVMCHEENRLTALQKTAVITTDSEGLITSYEEKPWEPKGNLAVPPFYYFRAEDLGRIQEALEDGCGYDAPGSFAAWLSTKTPMHAWKMPGVRYDIGDLESYRKVNERMG